MNSCEMSTRRNAPALPRRLPRDGDDDNVDDDDVVPVAVAPVTVGDCAEA